MPAPRISPSRPRVAALLAAAAVTLQPIAASAQKPCITERGIGALATFLVPTLIAEVRARCEGQLASDGFLAREGDAFPARYAALREAVWPEAKAAFITFAGADTKQERQNVQAMADTPDEVLQTLMEEAIAEKLGATIRPRSCRSIERMVEALAPIEPEVAANIIGVVAGLSVPKNPDVCEAEQP